MKKLIFTSVLILLTAGLFAQKAGTFDSTFNSTGIYIQEADIVSDQVYIDIQPDGKLVVAGSTYTGPQQASMFATRINPDGSVDTSFGNDGIVKTENSGNYMFVRDMFVQQDGKIVVAGDIYPAEVGFIMRINANGSVDTDYGANGVAIIDLYSDGSTKISGIDMHYDKDGRKGYLFSGTYLRTLADAKITSFLVKQFYDGDGYDLTFNSSNDYYYNTDTHNTGIKVQDDSTILTAGFYYQTSNTTGYFFISKKQIDGQPDPNFGRDASFDGLTVLNFNNGYQTTFQDFTRLYNDKILLVGEYTKPGETHTGNDIFCLRTTADGELDWAYGAEGRPYMNFEYSKPGIDYAYTVDEICDGKTLISGGGNNTQAGIVCLDSLGVVDQSFGNDGELLFDVQGKHDMILSSVLSQDTSTLYVAGGATNPDQNRTDLFIAALHTKTVIEEPKEPVKPSSIVSNRQHQLNIWPNPVAQSRYIRLDIQQASMENMQLQLLSANGQLIRIYSLEGKSSCIKLPQNLNAGIYFLILTSPDYKITEKLIIQ